MPFPHGIHIRNSNFFNDSMNSKRTNSLLEILCFSSRFLIPPLIDLINPIKSLRKCQKQRDDYITNVLTINDLFTIKHNTRNIELTNNVPKLPLDGCCSLGFVSDLKNKR